MPPKSTFIERAGKAAQGLMEERLKPATQRDYRRCVANFVKFFDSKFFVLNHLHQAGRESSRVKSVQSRYSKCDGYDGLFCLRWEMMGDDSAETPGPRARDKAAGMLGSGNAGSLSRREGRACVAKQQKCCAAETLVWFF